MTDKNNSEKKGPKVWPRTISPELHAAWKKLKRKKDPELMATALEYSRPVIDKALIYGFVSMPELTEKINRYFMERLKRENESAQGLMTAFEEVEKIKNAQQ